MTSETPDVAGERGRLRAVAGRLITSLAILLVWFSLIFPVQFSRLTVARFLRLTV